MTKRLRVLISGGGGDVAQAIVNCLEVSSLDIHIIVTSSNSWALEEFSAYETFLSPEARSPQYESFLIDSINARNIDVFIPTIDSEILRIANAALHIGQKTNATMLVGDPIGVEICDDKLRTCQFLRENGFAYPRSIAADNPLAINFAEEIGFPFIAKLRRGQGSQNLLMIENMREIEQNLGRSDLIFQERIDVVNREFTAGVYVGLDGHVKGLCILKRALRKGSTVVAERIINPTIEEQIGNIAQRLGLRYVNIQFGFVGEEVIAFEFNGRFSGSTFMQSPVINAPELYLREVVLGESINLPERKQRYIAFRRSVTEFTYGGSQGDSIWEN